jgi:heme-degrading monooxygenase HmoA
LRFYGAGSTYKEITMSKSRNEFAQINVFTPKPGMMETFMQTQLDGLSGLGDIPGSRGSRLYRARDDRSAVMIAFWEDEAAQKRFTESAAFQQHRQALLPLIEGTAPGFFDLVYAVDRD